MCLFYLTNYFSKSETVVGCENFFRGKSGRGPKNIENRTAQYTNFFFFFGGLLFIHYKNKYTITLNFNNGLYDNILKAGSCSTVAAAGIQYYIIYRHQTDWTGLRSARSGTIYSYVRRQTNNYV